MELIKAKLIFSKIRNSKSLDLKTQFSKKVFGKMKDRDRGMFSDYEKVTPTSRFKIQNHFFE